MKERYEIHFSYGTLKTSYGKPYQLTRDEISDFVEPLYGSIDIFTLKWKPYDLSYKLVKVQE